MSFEWTPDFWQQWREKASPYRQFKSECDRIIACEELQLHDGDSVLEVGCGYGWITQALLRAAAIRWIGVDRSAAMIGHLRSTQRGGEGACMADACCLPFPSRSFDKVLCTGVLMHIKDDFTALAELARVLRPSGLLLCSINNALSPYSVPAQIRNSFKTGFVQNFRHPATYRKRLAGLGLDVKNIRGDGLATTVSLNVGPISLPPRFAFRLLRRVDAWAVGRVPWLAYEVWFTAVKAAQCES